jgi:hypothetical protein
LRDASSRATKAFYPALSMCDLIFSGVFERHPRLILAIVEFELAWAPYLLSTMDYTYRERHGEAIYRFKNGMLPSDFFRRNVVLSFQEDAIGIRLRDVIGVDNMMWGSDYPHSESTFPQSRKILAEIHLRWVGGRVGHATTSRTQSPGARGPKTIAFPDECRRGRVRTRLAAGGRWIRTSGSAPAATPLSDRGVKPQATAAIRQKTRPRNKVHF